MLKYLQLISAEMIGSADADIKAIICFVKPTLSMSLEDG